MNKIAIFTEDTYGKQFISEIIKKLKDERTILRSTKISIHAMPRRCSSKLSRVLKLQCIMGCRKIIFIVDGDGKDEQKVKEKELIHGLGLRCQLTIIVNKYEIEEWILYAYNRKISEHPKPSVELKKIFPNYEKNQLHKVLQTVLQDQIKWNRLKQYEKFKELVRELIN